jgi:hypothetical protein
MEDPLVQGLENSFKGSFLNAFGFFGFWCSQNASIRVYALMNGLF